MPEKKYPMKKKTVKKAKPKKTKSKTVQPTMGRGKTSVDVNIKKVNNGFVVKSYGPNYDDEKIYIAKTKKEAKGYADKLLKI